MEVQSFKPRKRHALKEWPSWVFNASWDNGPGSLRNRVHYVAVDLWQQQADDYNDSANVASSVQVANLRAVLDLLAPFWPRVRLVQQPSLQAARLFDAGSL